MVNWSEIWGGSWQTACQTRLVCTKLKSAPKSHLWLIFATTSPPSPCSPHGVLEDLVGFKKNSKWNLDNPIYFPCRGFFDSSLPVHLPTTLSWIEGIFDHSFKISCWKFQQSMSLLKQPDDVQDSVRHRRGNPWRQKFPPYWVPENPRPPPVLLKIHL